MKLVLLFGLLLSSQMTFAQSRGGVFAQIERCKMSCSERCLRFIDQLRDSVNNFECDGGNDRGEILRACTLVFNGSFGRDGKIAACTDQVRNVSLLLACRDVFNGSFDRDSKILSCATKNIRGDILSACQRAFNGSFDRDTKILRCSEIAQSVEIVDQCTSTYNGSFDRDNKILNCIQ